MNINDDNYELWLLRYAEQELTAEERAEVERWLADHPEAAAELALYGEAPRLERDTEVHYTGATLQHSTPLWPVLLRWAAAAAVVAVLMMPAMRHTVAPKAEPTLVAENQTPASESLDNLENLEDLDNLENLESLESLEKTEPAVLLAESQPVEVPEPADEPLPETEEPAIAETAQPAAIEYVDNLIVFEDEIPENPSNIDILAAADVTYTRSTSGINPIGHFISTFIKSNK